MSFTSLSLRRVNTARVAGYTPSFNMMATATAAARAVGSRSVAPAVVGAVRSFWADVPMAPKVCHDRPHRSTRRSRSTRATPTPAVLAAPRPTTRLPPIIGRPTV